MWIYKSKNTPLLFQEKIKNLAKNVLTQYGGPDGELGLFQDI